MIALDRLDLQSATFLRDDSGWSPYESLSSAKNWAMELNMELRVIYVHNNRAREPAITVIPFENVKGWVVAQLPKMAPGPKKVA